MRGGASCVFIKFGKSKDLLDSQSKSLALIEKKYEQLYENVKYGQKLSRTGSWTLYNESGEMFITHEIYEILGISSEEYDWKLASYYSFVHPEDLDRVKKAVEGALDGLEYNIEYRIITADKHVKYVNEKATIVFDEHNNAIKTIGIIQDITEQKLLENNLKELGDNLNLAQRVAGLGSWKYDIIKDEYYGSEEMYRIYGVEPSEFDNDFLNVLKLIHPEDRYKVNEALKNHLAGQSCTIEYRIPQKDGSLKYVIGKGEPIFDKEGQVIGVIGTLQDITNNKILEQELMKKHRIIAQGQALAHTGSWEMDFTNNKIYYSDESYRIFGITQEQYDNTYEGFLKFVYPDDVKVIEEMLRNPSDKPIELEFRIIRSDGTIRNIYQLVEFVFNEEGKPLYLYGTIQDVTEKKMLEEEISKIQKRFKVLVQKSKEVFEIIDSDGTIKYISDASSRVIGYKPEERIGRNLFDFYQGDELQRIKDAVKLCIENPDKEIQGDVILKGKDGQNIYLEIHMQNLLHEPFVEGIVINFRDISKRIEMEKKMAYISTHDELTGLPNNRYFTKQLRIQYEYAKETQTRFAVMMLDIEGLKNINYSLGYDMGDKLILEIVQKLKECLGEKIFLSRYSDDHFAIIVQGNKMKSDYDHIATSIINLFQKPFHVANYDLDVFANIGISIFPNDTTNMFTLKKYAKVALLRAKKERKNTYKFYYSDLDILNYKESVLRSDLHNAIEKNQLRVYYQPMVNLITNEILAAEALIRWEHPDWGLVKPNEFIAMAEETGLIIDIGKWVLREVCSNYK